MEARWNTYESCCCTYGFLLYRSVHLGCELPFSTLLKFNTLLGEVHSRSVVESEIEIKDLFILSLILFLLFFFSFSPFFFSFHYLVYWRKCLDQKAFEILSQVFKSALSFGAEALLSAYNRYISLFRRRGCLERGCDPCIFQTTSVNHFWVQYLSLSFFWTNSCSHLLWGNSSF